jgi:PPOX class probable F420-dependent enzyme
MDVEEALVFVRENHHAVLATVRADGRPALSPVACGVDRDGMIVVSTRQTAMKTKHLRARPFCSLCVFTDRFYGPFVQIEGTAEIVELPEAMDHLVEYYRTVAGEHPDWDDDRAAMQRERRVMLRVRPERVGPTRCG